MNPALLQAGEMTPAQVAGEAAAKRARSAELGGATPPPTKRIR